MSDTRYCPMCGKPTSLKTSPEWLLGHWAGRFVNVLAVLIEARRNRRGLSIEELAEAAYIDRSKPGNAEQLTRVMITQKRVSLHEHGWTIMGPHETRNGYWLVPLEED